ncbi:MAG: hypothetical protein IKF17_03860 [Clostridia bacterium]|nr:hypothetical protein [Clostridia bacterium]
MVLHEPWRDEIHAWLMAKELSIPNLFFESKFDGHPILWHLILMPFAKLNFPIITLNMLSYAIMLISCWLFIFKTKIPLGIKLFAVFTIPYTYTFSAFSRNYTLIILLLTIIGIIYNKRNQSPIIYSILICLLIHTHSLAWGIVAGLTLTFHFYEIWLYFKKKNNTNIKSIILGLCLIVANTLLVVYELFGTSNSNYVAVNSPAIIKTSLTICIFLLLLALYTLFVLKDKYREFIIILCCYGFQIIIYNFVYSSILYQRFVLIFSFMLFYLVFLYSDEEHLNNIKYFILNLVFLFTTIICGFQNYIFTMFQDIQMPYSSAKEMAEYINSNIPHNTNILIDASVIGQSIMPYLNNNYTLYDIGYNEIVTCANVAFDSQLIENALQNLNAFSGNYLIISNNAYELNNCTLLYNTENSIINESFSLYYIP